LVLKVLSDGIPRTNREVAEKVNLTDKAVVNCLHRLWKGRIIFRTEKPIYEALQSFKGRSGIKKNTRAYHLYALGPKDNDSLVIRGLRLVKYKEKYLDKRGSGKSKAKTIRKFLIENLNEAYYSNELAELLKDEKIKQSDVMTTMRRAEKSGLVYVRGYRTHDGQTPFREGYLLTWLDPNKSREQAIEEAIQRTEKRLADKASTSPIIERVHMISDAVIEATKLRDLVGFDFIQNKINCTENEAESALKRAMQLYPDIKEAKIFNAYRYYYHSSMKDEDLKASIKMKENYIRIVKGKDNRIGHNWEAVPEWFIDKFTTGAKFWTQKHRTEGIDSRRITIHLIKSVGGRRNNAEVDRVWEVTPGIFANPITYILECKWGLIQKKYLDDFFEVLRWSKEFGVDTPEGRQIKQGVVGVFAGSAFNPKESVRLKDETVISLATYTARMNIQLLKAADFNEKLRERSVPKEITVQKICRIAKDEKEIRETLESIWETPEKGSEILGKTVEKNKEVYEFEKMLELNQ
jgi:DNA-binding Lrp family transcriptional regulator